MNLKSIFCLAMIILSIEVIAQEIPKFGKIPKSTVEMEVYEKDSSAEALILFDVGSIEFAYNQSTGWQTVFKRRTAIKIFSKSGYDWADQAISTYRGGGSSEVFSGLKGFTYNLENGKLIKSKLDKSSKYSEETNKYWNSEKFTMPDVKEGSVIEFTYQITSEFFFNLRSWEFQQAIPVLYSEYTTKIPEYYNYRKLTQGYYQFSKNEQSEGTKSIQLTSSERSLTKASNISTQQVQYQERRHKLAVNDIPAMRAEAYVSSVKNYIMKIDFELQSTNFPSGYKDYRNSWESLNKQFMDNQYFGSLLTKDAFIREEVGGISSSDGDMTGKAEGIYDLVRNKMSWNGFYSKYANTTLKQAYTKGTGNAADINLSLVTALKSAGFNSYPVLVSTRRNGLVRENFPISNQFNYVISALEMDGKVILLDATEKDLPFGFLPERCLNNKGWGVIEGGGKWIDLIPAKGFRRSTEMNLEIDENSMTGKLKVSRDSYASFSSRKKILEDGEEKYAEQFSDGREGWIVKSFSAENAEDPRKSLIELYDLEIEDGMENAGNLYFFNPLLVGQLEENPFKSERRDYPVDFTYPRYNAYMMKYTIPQGFSVEESPASKSLLLPNKKGRFIYSVTVTENDITVMSVIDIKNHFFSADEYPYLKEFFSQVVQKQAEQIVIKKKT